MDKTIRYSLVLFVLLVLGVGATQAALPASTDSCDVICPGTNCSTFIQCRCSNLPPNTPLRTCYGWCNDACIP